MTEPSIRPEEIRDALQKYVADYQPEAASKEEVGTVIDAGDGIAHVERSALGDGERAAASSRTARSASRSTSTTHEIGVVVLGDFDQHRGGPARSRRTGEVLSVPVGDGYLGRVVNPLGNPIDGLGDIADRRPPRPRAPGARRHAAQVGARAAADRHQGDRRDDPDRPRPAPADHRRPRRPARPRSRSTRSSTRRPTGRPATRTSRSAASTSPSARRARRSPPCKRRPRGGRRDGVHHHRRRPGVRPAPASSTSPPTPARPSASTGCTTASTS